MLGSGRGSNCSTLANTPESVLRCVWILQACQRTTAIAPISEAVKRVLPGLGLAVCRSMCVSRTERRPRHRALTSEARMHIDGGDPLLRLRPGQHALGHRRSEVAGGILRPRGRSSRWRCRYSRATLIHGIQPLGDLTSPTRRPAKARGAGHHGKRCRPDAPLGHRPPLRARQCTAALDPLAARLPDRPIAQPLRRHLTAGSPHLTSSADLAALDAGTTHRSSSTRHSCADLGDIIASMKEGDQSDADTSAARTSSADLPRSALNAIAIHHQPGGVCRCGRRSARLR
mgnify:CR=1 FL=1